MASGERSFLKGKGTLKLKDVLRLLGDLTRVLAAVDRLRDSIDRLF